MYIPYQPYQPYQGYTSGLQNGAQRSENNLIRVTGIEGAKAYQMPPNSTTALFDGGEDIFYIKSTDGAGFPTIRVYRFEEIDKRQPTISNSVYVTRTEFDELRRELTEGGKLNISGSGKKSNGGNKSTNGND